MTIALSASPVVHMERGLYHINYKVEFLVLCLIRRDIGTNVDSYLLRHFIECLFV